MCLSCFIKYYLINAHYVIKILKDLTINTNMLRHIRPKLISRFICNSINCVNKTDFLTQQAPLQNIDYLKNVINNLEFTSLSNLIMSVAIFCIFIIHLKVWF